MPIQGQTLAMIRRVTGSFLTDRCDVDAENPAARGEFGEPLHSWVNVASNEPCRMIMVGRKNSASEVVAGEETMVQEYQLIVSRDVALAVDQRVTVDSITYNVVRMETALTDEAFHSAILVRR